MLFGAALARRGDVQSQPSCRTFCCIVVVRARFFLTYKKHSRQGALGQRGRKGLHAACSCNRHARLARPLALTLLFCCHCHKLVCSSFCAYLCTSSGAGARSSVSPFPWRKSVSNLLSQSPCPHDLLRGHEAASYREGTCLPWEDPLRNLTHKLHVLMNINITRHPLPRPPNIK